MKRLKKMTSCLLIICMLFSMLPETVFASEQSQDGNPFLKDTNEVRWIDRLADLPDYATEFYAWLEENSDGDGAEDALINPLWGEDLNGEDEIYVHTVTTVSAESEFTYEDGASEEVINKAAEEVIRKNYEAAAEETRAYIQAVYDAFDRDHPKVFWLSGETDFCFDDFSYNIVSAENGEGLVKYDFKVFFKLLERDKFDIRHVEYRDYTKINNAIIQRDDNIETIIYEAAGNREEILKYFNTWLTENNCYNTSKNLNKIHSDCQECVSALEGNEGTSGPVCEGYARAFKVLCDETDIPCVLVSGEALGEPHMWNYVQMDDGKWYAVDVTWNDPTVEGVSDKLSGSETDNYFLVGSSTRIEGDDKTFGESHVVNNIVTEGGIGFINGPVLEENAYEAHLHTLEKVEGYESTCAKKGQKTYYKCSCGAWFEDEEGTIVIEDHDSVVLPLEDHDYATTITEPTCTQDGYTTYTCQACGANYKDDYVTAKGHQHTASFLWADDKTSCIATISCTACDEVKVNLTCKIETEQTEDEMIYTATCEWEGETYTDTVTGEIIPEDPDPDNPGTEDPEPDNPGTDDPNPDNPGTEESPFSDVSKDRYSYDAIVWAAENGITTGTGDGYFKPEDTCTREQVMTFIWRTMGEPKAESNEVPFPDVSKDRYSYDAIVWAAENGITTGDGNGNFRPEDYCTREQVMTFIWRTVGEPEAESNEAPFPDVSSDRYSYNAIVWAAENGITTGDGNGNFRPEDTCTREEVVTFLYRQFGKAAEE